MFKKILPLFLIIMSIGFSIVFLCDYWVTAQTQQRLYDSIDALPNKEIGLVLGTRKTLYAGQENIYFSARIEAAAKLIKYKKVKKLLLSGAREDDNYDELRDMSQDLLKLGVLPEQIMIDNEGFHTINSILRAKNIFKINDFIIVSQAFHNQRALYIADFYGLQAIGFNAFSPEWSLRRTKVLVREYISRVSLFVRLYLF
jgi:SanA protein